MSKEVRKGHKILKRLKLRSTMETFYSNQCLFCQRMSEERLDDIMQDSKDLELKTTSRECSLY